MQFCSIFANILQRNRIEPPGPAEANFGAGLAAGAHRICWGPAAVAADYAAWCYSTGSTYPLPLDPMATPELHLSGGFCPDNWVGCTGANSAV